MFIAEVTEQTQKSMNAEKNFQRLKVFTEVYYGLDVISKSYSHLSTASQSRPKVKPFQQKRLISIWFDLNLYLFIVPFFFLTGPWTEGTCPWRRCSQLPAQLMDFGTQCRRPDQCRGHMRTDVRRDEWESIRAASISFQHFFLINSNGQNLNPFNQKNLTNLKK